MLDGQVALHAYDNEYKNGRSVAKRMYEVICLAHETSEDPTANTKIKFSELIPHFLSSCSFILSEFCHLLKIFFLSHIPVDQIH